MATPHDDPPEMTPEELQGHLDELGLSQADLARLVAVDRGTPNHWLAGRTSVPRWAALYVRALVEFGRVTAALPSPLPERLRGLGVEKLTDSNNPHLGGIAFNQHDPTMHGMDEKRTPMQADAFKAALKALGWNQSTFARAVGCTVPTASRWANGAPIPGWVPVVLGLLLDVQRLHVRFVQPGGTKGPEGT